MTLWGDWRPCAPPIGVIAACIATITASNYYAGLVRVLQGLTLLYAGGAVFSLHHHLDQIQAKIVNDDAKHE